MMPTRERFILDVRAIPQWLLEKYILDLGGVISEDGCINGHEWTVYLEQQENYRIGSLEVGQIELVLEAEPDVFDVIRSELEKKLLRVGG
ncbi:MAG TPA: hypothetical protein VMV80_08750 [Anaerolineales bacterium]|jgi:hypothetical protein|nr:hypothetical protein [Anaerolineales bacterium]